MTGPSMRYRRGFGMAKTADPKARELIQTVSQISNGLMNEVAKVIIGKQ